MQLTMSVSTKSGDVTRSVRSDGRTPGQVADMLRGMEGDRLKVEVFINPWDISDLPRLFAAIMTASECLASSKESRQPQGETVSPPAAGET